MSHAWRWNDRSSRWLRLAAALLGIAAVWLIVLPAMSRHPAVHEHIRRNQERGINPDAMFYTEVGDVRGVRVRDEDGQVAVDRIQIGDRR